MADKKMISYEKAKKMAKDMFEQMKRAHAGKKAGLSESKMANYEKRKYARKLRRKKNAS